jgi:hypothetical protein
MHCGRGHGHLGAMHVSSLALVLPRAKPVSSLHFRFTNRQSHRCRSRIRRPARRAISRQRSRLATDSLGGNGIVTSRTQHIPPPGCTSLVSGMSHPDYLRPPGAITRYGRRNRSSVLERAVQRKELAYTWGKVIGYLVPMSFDRPAIRAMPSSAKRQSSASTPYAAWGVVSRG